MARILVSEGHDLARQFTEHILTDAGHEVLTAAHAAEVRLQPGLRTIDLLVTSLRLPGMSGEELIRRLWAAGYRLPVVIVTSFPSEVSIQSSPSGFVWVLRKPFSCEALRGTVEQAVSFRQACRKDGRVHPSHHPEP